MVKRFFYKKKKTENEKKRKKVSADSAEPVPLASQHPDVPSVAEECISHAPDSAEPVPSTSQHPDVPSVAEECISHAASNDTELPHEEQSSKNPPISLSMLEQYVILLRSNTAWYKMGEGVYALQDLKHPKLEVNKFQLLQRKCIVVDGKPASLWSCSCDRYRCEFIEKVPQRVPTVTQDVYNKCLHVQAIDELTKDELVYDTPPLHHEYSNPTLPNESPVFQVIADHWCTVAVYSREVRHKQEVGLGIVSVAFPLAKQMACLICHRCNRKRKCQHIELVQTNMDDNPVLEDIRMYLELDVELPEESGPEDLVRLREQWVPVCSNKGKFPFFEDKNYSSDIKEECDCGYSWDVVQTDKDILVFSTRTYSEEKVYTGKCASCGLEETGLVTAEPVLFMTHYGVSFEVMWDYLHEFVTNGTSMFGFFKTWMRKLCLGKNYELRHKIKYGRFRFAVLSFMHNLDVNFEEGYYCSICGPQPNMVVFDGMTLAFRKQLQLSEKPLMQSEKQYDGSQHTTRVFVNNKEARKWLYTFADTGLEASELEYLIDLMRRYQPALVDFLEQCLEQCLEHGMTAPPKLMVGLLKDLSKNVPVGAMLHPSDDVLNILQMLIDGQTLDVGSLATLHSKCPFISECLVAGKAEPSLRAIIQEMIIKSKAPFKAPEDHHPPCEQEDPYGYYPNLPELQQRGKYVLDAKPLFKESDCEKGRTRHPSLLPGIFSLLCTHGICYGFDVMDCAESPNCAFTCLRTRFIKGPDVVIYDNSCHLHSYSLNRCTRFFENTKFVVDRLHWANHTGCSRGYNLDAYSIYQAINTQVAEQRHAQLKKLKTMLSYMDSRNFQKFLAIYTYFYNCLKIVTLPVCPAQQLSNRRSFEMLDYFFKRN